MSEDQKKLEEVQKKVACPKNAMSIEGGEAMCNCPISFYRKEITKVSLGSIPEDILKHCGECKIKLGNKEEKLILNISEFHEVACPANSNKNVSAVDTCKTCPYFDKTHIDKIEKEGGENSEVHTICCSYPKPIKARLKVFLAPEDKKQLKKERAKKNQEEVAAII